MFYLSVTSDMYSYEYCDEYCDEYLMTKELHGIFTSTSH